MPSRGWHWSTLSVLLLPPIRRLADAENELRLQANPELKRDLVDQLGNRKSEGVALRNGANSNPAFEDEFRQWESKTLPIIRELSVSDGHYFDTLDIFRPRISGTFLARVLDGKLQRLDGIMRRHDPDILVQNPGAQDSAEGLAAQRQEQVLEIRFKTDPRFLIRRTTEGGHSDRGLDVQSVLEWPDDSLVCKFRALINAIPATPVDFLALEIGEKEFHTKLKDSNDKVGISRVVRLEFAIDSLVAPGTHTAYLHVHTSNGSKKSKPRPIEFPDIEPVNDEVVAKVEPTIESVWVVDSPGEFPGRRMIRVSYSVLSNVESKFVGRQISLDEAVISSMDERSMPLVKGHHLGFEDWWPLPGELPARRYPIRVRVQLGDKWHLWSMPFTLEIPQR